MKSLTLAQIERLQKSVNKKMEPVFKKRDVEETLKIQQEKENRMKPIFHMSNIFKSLMRNDSEKVFLCLHDNKVWALGPKSFKNDKRYVEDFTEKLIGDRDITSDEMFKSDNKNFKLVKETTESGKGFKFFELTLDENSVEARMTRWVHERYADVKIAVAMSNSKEGVFDSSSKLTHILTLGGIIEEFSKEFPDTSMIDFIKVFKEVDKSMIDHLSRLR